MDILPKGGALQQGLNFLSSNLVGQDVAGAPFTVSDKRTWGEHKKPKLKNTYWAEGGRGPHRIARNWAGSGLQVENAIKKEMASFTYRPGKTCKCVVTRAISKYGWRSASEFRCCPVFPDCAC